MTLKSAGGAVPRRAPQRRAGTRADAPQHPLRQVRRPEVPRRRACQGHAGAAALRRKSARPRRRLSRRATAARHRPGATREKIVAAAAADDRFATLAALKPPAKAREAFAEFAALLARLAHGAPWPSDLGEAIAWRRAQPRGRLRQRRLARGRPRRAGAHRRHLRLARAFPERTDARSARRDQRRSGAAASRRGLSHPLHHPFGQGPGVEIGVRAQLRRRLHSLRPGDRHRARRSRRSGVCSTSR